MNIPFSATSACADPPTLKHSTRETTAPVLQISDDVPDWSSYAWSNPTRVVYGPVSSRRLGQSLGINLFPQGKICSFRCAYCDLDVASGNLSGARMVATPKLISKIAAALTACGSSEASSPPSSLDSITFAGNGEPTLHVGFNNVVKEVVQLRDEWLPGTPMNLFTDGMHLETCEVLAATTVFHRVFLKLDGASRAVLERLNGPGAWAGIGRGISIAQALENVAASTALVDGAIGNIDDVQSRAFVGLIHKLAPCELYLYTLDYPSPSPLATAVSFDTLVGCAEWLADRVTCPVIVLWRRHRPGVSNESTANE